MADPTSLYGVERPPTLRGPFSRKDPAMKRLSAACLVFGMMAVAARASQVPTPVRAHYYPGLQKVQLHISRNLFHTPAGRPGLAAGYYDHRNLRGEAVTTRTESFPELDSGRAYHENYGIR